MLDCPCPTSLPSPAACLVDCPSTVFLLSFHRLGLVIWRRHPPAGSSLLAVDALVEHVPTKQDAKIVKVRRRSEPRHGKLPVESVEFMRWVFKKTILYVGF